LKKILKYKFIISFFVIFGLVLYYLYFFSVTKYQSSSVITLIEKDNNLNQTFNMLGIQNNNDYLKDIHSLELFLSSENFFKKVDKKFNLRNYYTSKEHNNFYERLSSNSYKEEFLNRFQKDINFFFNPDYNTIVLSFIYDDKILVKDILKYMIHLLEEEINIKNKINIRKELKYINKEIIEKKIYIKNIENKIINFQNKFNIFDPEKNLEIEFLKISKLKEEILNLDIQYKNLSSYMSITNPDLIKIKNKLNLLKLKQKTLEKKLLGNNNIDDIKKIIFKFKKLKNELELQNKLFAQIMLNYEKLKLDLLKNSKSIKIILEPNKPEKPFFPNYIDIIPMLLFVLVFFLLSIKYSLMIIEEHKD